MVVAGTYTFPGLPVPCCKVCCCLETATLACCPSSSQVAAKLALLPLLCPAGEGKADIALASSGPPVPTGAALWLLCWLGPCLGAGPSGRAEGIEGCRRRCLSAAGLAAKGAAEPPPAAELGFGLGGSMRAGCCFCSCCCFSCDANGSSLDCWCCLAGSVVGVCLGSFAAPAEAASTAAARPDMLAGGLGAGNRPAATSAATSALGAAKD